MAKPVLPHPQHPSSSSNNQFNMASHNNSPYLSISPVPSSGSRPMGTLCNALNRCARKAEALVDDFWNHLRVSPSITDAAVARIAQGTKLLAEGGHDRLFRQTFQILPGEKLLHSYVCYLSTSSGPVIGYQHWMYYKVVIELDKLATVDPSANRLNPSEKYIHMITRDGYEFWFMGFISYDKALKSINEALQHSCRTLSLF